MEKLKKTKCLIIDNYQNNIEHKFLYSLLNQSKQLENYILVNSVIPLKIFDFNTPDLQSRMDSFLYIGIELPTDDLLK